MRPRMSCMAMQRGDELPEQLRTREGRRRVLPSGPRASARPRRSEARASRSRPGAGAGGPEPSSSSMPSGSWRAIQGREGWTREAHRQLEQRRWEQAEILFPAAREDRLLLAGERLEAERDAQIAANRAYEEYRENGRDTHGPAARSPTEAVGRAGAARRGGERERSRYPADEGQPRVRAGL